MIFIDNVVTEYCTRFVSRIEVAFSEWKTTFNAVYGTDYESKKIEYEQMDITKIHDNNYPVDRALLYFIRLTIVSGLVAIPSVFIKYIW